MPPASASGASVVLGGQVPARSPARGPSLLRPSSFTPGPPAPELPPTLVTSRRSRPRLFLRGAPWLKPLQSSPCPRPTPRCAVPTTRRLVPSRLFIPGPPQGRGLCCPALSGSQQHHEGLRKDPPPSRGGCPSPPPRRRGSEPTSHCWGSRGLVSRVPRALSSPRPALRAGLPRGWSWVALSLLCCPAG